MEKITCPGCHAEIDPASGEAHFHPDTPPADVPPDADQGDPTPGADDDDTPPAPPEPSLATVALPRNRFKGQP